MGSDDKFELIAKWGLLTQHYGIRLCISVQKLGKRKFSRFITIEEIAAAPVVTFVN